MVLNLFIRLNQCILKLMREKLVNVRRNQKKESKIIKKPIKLVLKSKLSEIFVVVNLFLLLFLGYVSKLF